MQKYTKGKVYNNNIEEVITTKPNNIIQEMYKSQVQEIFQELNKQTNHA